MQRLITLGCLLVLSGSAWSEASPTTGSKPLKLDRSAILRELRDVSLAGMDRRLGPDYASYHKQGPQEKFPDIWMPEVKGGEPGRRWEIGGPWVKEAGDFSSTQGQILYVPEQGIGVDRVTIIEWSNGCFSERPEPPWNCGSRPDPTSEKWQAALANTSGVPLGAARGMGGWSNCGVILFPSGLLATAGTVTAKATDPVFQFPKHKLPTAVSVSNKNEFALVTVVDTDAMKGQVAVLALESHATHFPHEWQDEHTAMLPNVGLLANIKLLGYVDLPGIAFPTGVCAVGNRCPNRLNGPDGNAGMLSQYDLAKQASRDVFNTGSNADYSSRAGFAVVISKYENKVAFLDLQPLFERVRTMYFTTEQNYQKTRDSGPGPQQWPPTFEADPSWRPPVVAVLDQADPSAVIASLEGGKKARAIVASRNGQVRIYGVGGLATEAPATAQHIQCLSTVQVGRNPVCLAYQKFSSDTFIAVARGDRELAWIKVGEQEAQVIRRLRDARLLDPVQVEVSDTHGIETSLLTVADFKGRKIINYRYSELVFATQGGARFGMGPQGKDPFECGGIMEFPGAPFCISATNVN